MKTTLAISCILFACAAARADVTFQAGRWQVAFADEGERLVLSHADGKAVLDGRLEATGPADVTGAGVGKDLSSARWRVVSPRDGARERLALVDTRGNVDGYVSFQADGEGVSMLVYHRTAFAFAGSLVFSGDVRYRDDAYPCSLSARAGGRVLSVKSGFAVSALDDALFSPSTDEALRLSNAMLVAPRPGRAAGFRAVLVIDDPAAASFAAKVEKDWYKSRWVPYWRPLDRSRAPRAPTGWLSWNTYFDQAGSKENLDEARFAAKWLKPFGLEFWNVESWQDNSPKLPVSNFHNMNLETYAAQFPEGMKWLADEIRKLGFRPGLWMAPFGTGNEAFYRAHRDWFLHDAGGRPISCWNGRFTLDPTVPAAREHLKRIFSVASREWGYEFFKIDGMSGRGPGYCAHLYERPEIRARFADPACPNPFELCVRAFREGIGDDRVFLACQGHFTGAEAAYADASRTGADIVHPNEPVGWENILLQSRCTVNQFFAHANVFWSDPDCMLVSQDALGREQAQVEATVVALPGQQTFAGDKLAALAPDRVRLIQQALPACPTRPGCLCPQFGRLPVWDLHVARPFGDWHVVALFNWDDAAKGVSVAWEEIGERADRAFVVWEFWTGTYLGERKGALSAAVPPRGVRLFALQPRADRPQFLTSDRHLTQGAVELRDVRWRDGIEADVAVVGGFDQTLRFTLPAGWSPTRVEMNVPGRTSWRTESDGRVLAVTLAPRESGAATLSIAFDAPVAARFGRGGTGGLLELSREAKDDIDSRFAERIRAIRAAPDREIPAGAEHRYLSAATGDDSADGKTRATAWRTTGRLNKEKLSPGTFVLFERGGVYRGGVSACDGVTYAAYGKGEKPTVCSSPEDGADPAKWEPTDAEGVWRYMIGGRDVGTLVFDGGAALAVKIVPVYHADGTFTQQYGGRPFDNGYKDLAGDLHFWHDYSAKTKFQPHAKGSGYLYLRSKENPGRRFRSIEFCVRRHGFEVGRHTDVTIDNICVKYVGSHGVGAGTTRNLKVVNCEFAWIGGSIQAEGLFGRNAPVRFGNAVEVYGGCDDYVVDGCYVHDVYDAGVTHQYNWKGGAPVDMKNVRYSRNVIERCNYSVEYFLKPVTNVVGDTSHMENIVIEGNLMRDAARGFCEHRPDRRQGAHIKSWRYWGGEHHTNRARGYVIRDNVFDRSGDMLVEISSSLLNPDGSDSMPTLSDNVFVGEKGQRFGVLNQGKVVELAYDDDLPARLGPDVAGNNVFLSTR